MLTIFIDCNRHFYDITGANLVVLNKTFCVSILTLHNFFSKIGLYLYTDGSLRVVVSTANLYYEDWNRYNQGLWLSPACPRLPDSSSDDCGSGPTHFKTELLTYLKSYNIPCLKDWIGYVKRADFSDVK